ncbi:hypothetical protein Tco_1242058 [Tanacetum coccineum]
MGVNNLNNSVSHANEVVRNTVPINPPLVGFHTGSTYPTCPPYSTGLHHMSYPPGFTLIQQAQSPGYVISQTQLLSQAQPLYPPFSLMVYSSQPATQSTSPPSQPAIQPGNTGTTTLSGQATTLPHAFNTETFQDPASGAWNMDTCASSHLNASITSLNYVFNTCIYPSVLVGDEHSIPVTNTGHSILPTPFRSLHLNNVLITPYIVKNLIYVHLIVRDNNCTIKFDAFGFSVKDFMTRRVLL